jgi:hypothetical protein
MPILTLLLGLFICALPSHAQSNPLLCPGDSNTGSTTLPDSVDSNGSRRIEHDPVDELTDRAVASIRHSEISSAEQLYKRALALSETASADKRDRMVLKRLYGLARVYTIMQRHVEAIPLYEGETSSSILSSPLKNEPLNLRKRFMV